MPPHSRTALAGVAAVLLPVALLAACGSGDDWSEPHAAPTPVGALGVGFTDPASPPTPEATVRPEPGSWDDVRPPAGYRVVLVTLGDDAPTTTLVAAVTDWAEAEDVSLRTVEAEAPSVLDDIDAAVALQPDLVISAGNELVDPMTTVTPHHLEQQFLVVGAELAEPTGNVTSADWTGASFRGEGLGSASAYDPTTFTPERAGAALRAGVASVLHGVTGIVLWID